MRYSRASLESVPINAVALQLVPQSVAQEHCVLAIGFEGDALRLIVPTDFMAESGHIIRFILNREFIVDHADRSLLLSLIDHHYAAANSDITNCNTQLRFICPKQWADLTPTDCRDERLCQSCNRLVYFCYTQIEFDRRRDAGDCVAFCDPDASGSWMGLPE